MRIEEMAREEANRAEPPPSDWPKTRQIRWELFHDGARMDRWPGTGLFVAMKDLRDLGYSTTKTAENGTTVYRAAPGNGQRPAGVPVRGRRGRPPGSKTQIRTEPPKPEPPKAPELGANLVVFALLAHDGEVVVGLAGRDGGQWFATLTEPPLP